MESISSIRNFKTNNPIYEDVEEISSRSSRKESRKLLRKQLKAAEDENDYLKQRIIDKDSDLEEMRKNLDSLNDMMNSTIADGIAKGSTAASTKIMEISKKNRQLTAELEAAKSKYLKSEEKLQTEINKNLVKKDSRDGNKKASSCTVATNLETLTDQLNSNKQKFFETLNQNTELRNSLKLAQKCIQQEIGENINLNILAASNSNWRGRQQQIIALQNKIAELKEKIEIGNLGDDSIKQELRKMDIAHRAEIEEFSVQLNEARHVIDDQKNKMSALKARNKNLVDEAMNYKMKSLNLMEKTGDSDNSIAVLNEKLNIQKYHYENKMEQLKTQIEDLEKLKIDANIESVQVQMKLDNAENILLNREQTINELQETIDRLENDLRAVCGDFLFGCRDLSKEEFVALLDALEAEKNGLIKQVSTINERVECEREKVSNLTDLLNKQKVKFVRLEAKLKDLQKEMENLLDKKKRTQRISDYTKTLSQLIPTTLVTENSNSSTGNIYESKTMETVDIQIEDLKNKLEIAKERITFLEDKLLHLKSEKDTDTNAFNEILNNSKYILLNMIQQSKIPDLSESDDSQEFNINEPTSEMNHSAGSNSVQINENENDLLYIELPTKNQQWSEIECQSQP